MNATERTIRKFNPGTFQSDEEVIEQFVVRNRELGTVLETLRGNIESPSCQHLLVVAPRGRGKTMLLARTAAEIRTNEALSNRLFPVRFMEESQEIFNMADFWLETLFHLAGEVASTDAELARQLRRSHTALTGRWREESLEELARSAVLETADRLSRKLVLMVENLQELSEDVDRDFGWQLRGALQSESQIMLVASATSRFQDLDDAGQPFFELFRMVSLHPLTTQECRRLWQVVSGDMVSGREIRPLEILTGGSPRLLVIVAGFAQHRSIRQLMEELVALIDEHTEYFRGHLDVLAKTERRAYLAVLDLWQPSKTGEIAARARMNVRTVSTMLGRLVNRGAVIVEGVGRRHLYSAAERLFCIYYKLRRERDESAVIQSLIRFMAVFYSKAELAEMSGRLSWEAAESEAIRKGIEQALHKVSEVESDYSRTAWPEIKRISSLASAIAEMMLEKEIDSAFTEGRFDRVIEIADQAFVTQDSGLPRVVKTRVGWALFEKAVAFEKSSDIDGAIATYEEVVERFGKSDIPEFQDLVARALIAKGRAHGRLGDHKLEVSAYEEIVERFGASVEKTMQWWVATALISIGIDREENDEIGGAIAAYEEVIERFSGSETLELQKEIARALVKMGRARKVLGEIGPTIAAFEEVLNRFGGSDVPELQWEVARALIDTGIVREEVGEFEGAIAAYKEVLERFDSSDEPPLQLAIAAALSFTARARVQVDEIEGANSAFEEVVERFGDSEEAKLTWWVASALLGTGSTRETVGEFEGAITAYEEVVGRFSGDDAPQLQERVALALIGIGRVQGEMGEIEGAISTLDDVATRFDSSSDRSLRWWVARALVLKGVKQTEINRAEEALQTCDELERRLGMFVTGNEVVELRWQAICIRMRALLIQGRQRAAVKAFSSAYETFAPRDELMMREVLGLVSALVAAGAPENDLVKVLSSDRTKADALAPLVVALRQRAGEVVRAPAEILEVAADIRTHIDEVSATGNSNAS